MKTNGCFGRTKSMDLNDFLIHSNTLNIRLSRNLNFAIYGDRFREYINKWQSVLYGTKYSRMVQIKFLKAVFHKFYLVHSWVLCPILVLNYFRGVFRKRCSENMQQMYRRTPCWSVISIKLLHNFLLQICSIFLKHLFIRTPLEGCFWYSLQTSENKQFFQFSGIIEKEHWDETC